MAAASVGCGEAAQRSCFQADKMLLHALQQIQPNLQNIEELLLGEASLNRVFERDDCPQDLSCILHRLLSIANKQHCPHNVE